MICEKFAFGKRISAKKKNLRHVRFLHVEMKLHRDIFDQLRPFCFFDYLRHTRFSKPQEQTRGCRYYWSVLCFRHLCLLTELKIIQGHLNTKSLPRKKANKYLKFSNIKWKCYWKAWYKSREVSYIQSNSSMFALKQRIRWKLSTVTLFRL